MSIIIKHGRECSGIKHYAYLGRVGLGKQKDIVLVNAIPLGDVFAWRWQ